MYSKYELNLILLKLNLILIIVYFSQMIYFILFFTKECKYFAKSFVILNKCK